MALVPPTSYLLPPTSYLLQLVCPCGEWRRPPKCDFLLSTPCSLSPISYLALPTSLFLLPTLPTTYFLLPTPYMYFLLPTPYFLLLAALRRLMRCSLLPTSYSLLPTPYFLLPTSYFLLQADEMLKRCRRVTALWQPQIEKVVR